MKNPRMESSRAGALERRKLDAAAAFSMELGLPMRKVYKNFMHPWATGSVALWTLAARGVMLEGVRQGGGTDFTAKPPPRISGKLKAMRGTQKRGGGGGGGPKMRREGRG